MHSRFRSASVALIATAIAVPVLFGSFYPAPPLPHRTEAAPLTPSEPARFSMFAVGDTGRKSWLPSLRSGQLAVARELTAADLAQPADALVLLGDNFYPSGLSAADLIPRIRENLVKPYCRFVSLDGPDSWVVSDACTLPAELLRRANPPSILAVLGNHDRKDPDSPSLQADAVPRFVSNWRASAQLVSLVEFEAGVSLILVDSTLVTGEEDIGPVRDALRSARGPWRIAVAHHPIAQLDSGVPDESEVSAALLRRAIAEAGVSVHVFLSGHRHNLQVIEMDEPSRILQLIAGGGANVRPIEHHYANRRFALERNGFARVELVEREGSEILVAELWSTERYPIVFWRGAQRVARWRVSPSGATSREALWGSVLEPIPIGSSSSLFPDSVALEIPQS